MTLINSSLATTTSLKDNFTPRICSHTRCSLLFDHNSFYENLTFAKLECGKNKDCRNVYDAGCDGAIFKLCKVDTKNFRSDEGSCLHIPNHGVTGNIAN